ncbi:glycoside hydrolase superfamily [Lipomyces orientalis]|uniref:Glycoside hydrolase superfamily n=1 Tax=Lipomyces orientalis TaxID=1233043 RepID=A0ACC3TUN7_9ASCO
MVEHNQLDIEATLVELTTTEKISLLAGTDFWHTQSIPRLDIPAVRMPATWDTLLLEEAGKVMGEEPKAKGAVVILGPTVSIQRSPLRGRGFESFSEDPFLSGSLAAAEIRANSIVSDRAIRKIYLLPFQLAVCDAQPAAFMTSYNKLNEGILLSEWNWKGIVMSEPYGTYSTSRSINAGIDIEMPGPTRFRGANLGHAIFSKKITSHVLDERVRNVLELVNCVAPLGMPENAEEKMRNTSETAQLLRKVAPDSVVFLKNDNKVVLFDTIIGPNAKVATYCGGGSASLTQYYAVNSSRSVSYTVDAYSHKLLPLLDSQIMMDVQVFTSPDAAITGSAEPIDQILLRNTNNFLGDYKHPQLQQPFYAKFEGYFTPQVDGVYDFGIAVAGTAYLYVDDKLLVDNATNQKKGEYSFGLGTVEESNSMELMAGTTYHLKALFGSMGTSKIINGSSTTKNGAVRLGCALRIDADNEIDYAKEIAISADQVVLCVGLNLEWESEGYDRTLWAYRVVVVYQSGTPVTMPWVSKVAGLVQAWYGGNEAGNAIADILFGHAVPSSKLPLSFPVLNEDNPAFLNYRYERGRVLYGEDVYVGYRFYDKTRKKVNFPFGYGLPYTTFELSDIDANIGEATLKVKIYISQHAPSINRPPKELKGYRKIEIAAGASEVLEISISTNYAFWDEERSASICENGTYTIAASTRTAKLQTDLAIEKTTCENDTISIAMVNKVDVVYVAIDVRLPFLIVTTYDLTTPSSHHHLTIFPKISNRSNRKYLPMVSRPLPRSSMKLVRPGKTLSDMSSNSTFHPRSLVNPESSSNL